jgi:E3 SUMO-protein ligase RanBP2
MEQRLKTLEDLCGMITKEVVDQNKNMMEMNKNLLNEIRYLRESFVKQDDYFEEFKLLLRKLLELNKQNAALTQFPANLFTQLPPPLPGQSLAGAPIIPTGQQPPSQLPTPTNATISSTSHLMNNSYLNDYMAGGQNNQSMINNVSFQSERTPFNNSVLPPSFNNNLNTTTSSIPSSASALQKQQQQQQNLLKQSISNQQQQQKPIITTQQQQPQLPSSTMSMFNINKNQVPQQIPTSTSESNIKFLPQTNTTSTPQSANLFAFKPSSQTNNNQLANLNNNKPPPFQLSPNKPTLTDSTNQQKPPSIFGSNLFKTDNKPLPSTTTGTSIFSAPPPANLFKAPQPTTLEETVEDGEETAGANPEEYEPQVDFKPIVQLKEVEVKTGEEDENVLLAQRCKLFRFVSETKEWKEKGTGELKLLKHKQTNVVRLLMRRDQVLKLCANHRLTPELKLSELSDKQFSWMAVDFSDNVSKNEIFLAKFKTPEEGKKFKTVFEQAVLDAKSLPPTTPNKQTATTSTTNQISNKPTLSEQFKSENWSCSGCYVSNKKDDLKCVCCDTNKPGSESTSKIPTSNTSPSISTLSNQQQPPKSQSTFSFGMPAASSGTTPNKPLFAFGTQPQVSANSSGTPPKFDFSSKEFKAPTSGGFAPINNNNNQNSLLGSQPQQGTSLFGQNTNLPSFGSLASNGPLFGKPSQSTTTNDTSSLFKSIPATGFGGGIQPATQPAKPLFGSTATQNEDGEEGADNPEEYEPQVEFKPLVKLQEVEVKTGEEDEIAVFKQRCKLYRFISETKEWKEKGTGEMKLLKHRNHGNMFRILMRRDQVLKLCANHRITSDLKFEIYNEKQVRWHVQDYSENEGKHELLAARFKSEEDAKKFKEECENAQKLIASSDSTASIITKNEESKPSIEGKGTVGADLKNENKVTVGSNSTNSGPISFGTQNISFGASSKQPADDKKTIESVFNSKPGMSFADLAKTTQPMGFGGGFKSMGAAPLFGSSTTPVKPLFGSMGTTAGNEEEGEEAGENANPEEYEPQVDFKPLVKLHEVEVKTGEEDEEILFKQRCKIYRFDNNAKEWKEKGAGEIKILKHKQKENHYRVLMRRDQVLKLCANHRISPDTKLELINEKQVRYLINDCSESAEPHPEYLTIRFRNEEDAKKFKSEFERIQSELTKVGSSTATKTVPTNNNVNNNSNTKNGLASLIKQGTWSCDSCLTSNKPDVNECAACEAPKPSNGTKNKDDNDVIITDTVSANKDQIEQARKLQLPDNFYLYTNKPPCPGCRGCQRDD